MHCFLPGFLPLRKDFVPPRPLGLDRIMENLPLTSDSVLLNLPIELLGTVLEFMEFTSLEKLALVNRVCRQLARSRQFAEVHLQADLSSEALLHLLASETEERMKNNGSASLPSLGACIRRMTVEVNPPIVVNTPYRLRGKGQRRVSRWFGPWGLYTPVDDICLSKLQMVICNGITLPHLQSLDWNHQIYLSPSFFGALACSSLQHLTLCNPPISDNFNIRLLEDSMSHSWPLRYLHLELGQKLEMERIRADQMWTSVLRACAPTLKTLVWSDEWRPHGEDPQPFQGNLPDFPSLRNFRLGAISPREDASFIDHFLKSNLINLSFERASSSVDEALGRRGNMPSLENFAYHKPLLSFLQANSTLTKIDFETSGFSGDMLESQILPLLSTFPNLTSLRVAWPHFPTVSELPEKSLGLIGNIRSLDQLCIRCGCSGEDRRSWWKVDHGAIRQQLLPLARLKKLALWGDTYQTHQHQHFDSYYTDTFATRADLTGNGVAWDDLPEAAKKPAFIARLGKPYWEKRHKRYLVKEVEKYAPVFLGLEWIYLGRRAMSIEVDGIVSVDLKRPALHLGKMFGCSFLPPVENL